MSTSATQIRIDSKVKKEASELFESLGLDMSGAVNMFLRQCVLRGGLPFPVELPAYSRKTEEAMEEARKISHDPNVKAYYSMDELTEALEK